MKSSIAAWLLVALALTGCSNSTPGGPRATDPDAKSPLYGQADDTFNLGVPVLSTSIKQGETKAVSISIKRGRNFDQDVTLKFGDMPKGVTLEPGSPRIQHGDTDAKMTLKAADDAALGDFTVTVTGHPAKGADASKEFKITVNKK